MPGNAESQRGRIYYKTWGLEMDGLKEDHCHLKTKTRILTQLVVAILGLHL